MSKADKAAAAAAETAPSVPAAVTQAPEEWAAQAFPPVGAKRDRNHPSLWQHAAAAALHGWAEHAHHAGAPMRLSAEDYFAALVAASEPDTQGNYRPHPGALSRHAPARKG